MKEKIQVVDVFFQNYGPDEGIQPHWCCKFILDGYAEYEYFATATEAYGFAKENGYPTIYKETIEPFSCESF